MQNFLSYEKRTLDHWTTVQFYFSLAQVRCFWRCFCFRSGLVALFLKMSECGDSWCTDSSFISILVKLSQVFESALLAVVDKVHRSSTWVKVQIRIIKYYSSKSKSTAFSILLEWKYKSTQFFMYLSKKVLIDIFILQFYIDYFI